MDEYRKGRAVLHVLDNESAIGRPPPAVVRYDGDPAGFAELTAAWLADLENDDAEALPPAPQYFRWNPDPSGYYSVVLAAADGPGRGAWLGSYVELTWTGTGPVAERNCSPCEARPGEQHMGWCPFTRLAARQASRQAKGPATGPD